MSRGRRDTSASSVDSNTDEFVSGTDGASDATTNSSKNSSRTRRRLNKSAVESRRSFKGFIAAGSIVQNPNLEKIKVDTLYHLGLNTQKHNMVQMFGDVKFVVCSGSPSRMEKFTTYLRHEINIPLPTGTQNVNIAEGNAKYVLYKAGPVIACSHGMGTPSMCILLHEIMKLLHHAGCKNVTMFRIGTCGGIGVSPGSVVISGKTLDPLFREQYDQVILGEEHSRPALLDGKLSESLVDLKLSKDNFDVLVGKTYCSNDFYEGQGRTDGCFCDFSEEDRLKFLNLLHEKGVLNIDLEGVAFAAMTHLAGFRAATLLVTLLDRMKGDQVRDTADKLRDFQNRPMKLVTRYIKREIGL